MEHDYAVATAFWTLHTYLLDYTAITLQGSLIS
jgi:hypothetical protein